MELSVEQFEEIVSEALEALPEQFRARLDNIAVVIEEEPTAAQLHRGGLPHGESLFGLYEGVPQSLRDSGYTGVLPDKVTIFRRPLLAACETVEELRNEIRNTVRHEIAHHFGIDDDRLEAIGKY